MKKWKQISEDEVSPEEKPVCEEFADEEKQQQQELDEDGIPFL